MTKQEKIQKLKDDYQQKELEILASASSRTTPHLVSISVDDQLFRLRRELEVALHQLLLEEDEQS
jgi:hypothetical protein